MGNHHLRDLPIGVTLNEDCVHSVDAALDAAAKRAVYGDEEVNEIRNGLGSTWSAKQRQSTLYFLRLNGIAVNPEGTFAADLAAIMAQ